METSSSNRSTWIAAVVIVLSIAALALLLVTRQRFGAQPAGQPQLSDLIAQTRRLTEQHEYVAALSLINQILALDPNNTYALGAKPLIEDRALILQQRQGPRAAYSDIIRYPTNWPNLKELRDRTTASDRGQRAEDQEVLAKLDRKLPEIKFDAVGFNDVVEFLRDVSSANIFVNWKALQDAGVARDTPVTARLRDVKFSKAMDIILRDVGGGNIKLGYTVNEGVITVSTADDLASNVVTNVYDIRDLIVDVQDFVQPPTTSATEIIAKPASRPAMREQLVNQIINLIKETVAADSWLRQSNSIRELSGQLIIAQTPENQRSITRLIEQLRETRAVQIMLEPTLLVVKREVSAESTKTVSDATTFTRGTTTQPGNIVTDLSTSATFTRRNAGMADNVLDDATAKMLIASDTNAKAGQRLTLYNGQQATIVLARLDGSSATVTFQGTISSDRQFVTLTVAPVDQSGKSGSALLATTQSIPDRSTVLVHLDSNDLWLAVRATMIVQREP